MAFPGVPGQVNGRRARIMFADDSLSWSIATDQGSFIAMHEVPESQADSNSQIRFNITSIEVNDLPQCFLQKFHCVRPKHLRQGEANPTEVHVVVSTAAGTRRASSFFHHGIEPLLGLLEVNHYETHRTESSSSIIEFAERILFPRALSGVSQTVILLSGDGGLVDLIKCFSKKQGSFVPPYVVIIPMGTGNATANSSQFEDMTEGLSTMVRGSPRPLPMFTVRISPGSVYLVNEGRSHKPIPQFLSDTAPRVCGAVVLSWGLHASLVADSDTTYYRKYGADRFKMVAADLLKLLNGNEEGHYRGKVSYAKKNTFTGEVEQREIESNSHMYTLITLVSHLEKNYTISPLSKPLDGQLRLVHIGGISSEETRRLVALPYQGGKHVNEPTVTYEAIESLRIEFKEYDEQWRRICIDGQIIIVDRDGWLEVERSDQHFFQLVCRN
ncbi:hypothetical protein KEM54_006544 [Ascosphaera aggregata]|nr:hypothetical protein KEM54_006544 [Ascosphaera aggregata]